MNKLVLAAGTTLVLIASGVGASSVGAAPGPSASVRSGVSSETAPAFAPALERDLRLTPEQARNRLAADQVDRAVEAALRARLAGTWAGSWRTADGRLVVAATSGAQFAAVRAAGAEARLVARSASRLDRVRAVLDRHAGRAAAGVRTWYVDAPSNSVVVTADTAATGAAFVAASGVGGADRTAVRVVPQATEAPRPLYDVRGGDQYVINGNTLCSIGFSVAGGFVTAGHCGAAGSPTLGYNNVAQGSVAASTFPGNDYGWVRVNGDWTPQPWVNDYAGGNAPVAGSLEAGIGAAVCRSGRTTGWHCGVIQAKNVTVNYAQGAVYSLTQSNACAEPGDSGGAWISGDQAQGTTSGGSGNCTSGGTEFFQPVNATLSRYGLSLVTTGGGSGTSRIVGYAGKCIDVPGGNGADGQYLQLYDCNPTPAQAWTFAGDGTVRALGKCMDVASGSRDNGAVIQLANCSGNPAQQFVLSAAGDLVNPQSNKCVDVTAWNSANGARIEQWDCTGGANQKWHRG